MSDHDMEFKRRDQPDLVESFIHKKIKRFLRKKPSITIPQRIGNWIKNFYYDYISENKVFVLLIVGIAIFLYYRYKMTQEEKRKAEIRKKRKRLLKKALMQSGYYAQVSKPAVKDAPPETSYGTMYSDDKAYGVTAVKNIYDNSYDPNNNEQTSSEKKLVDRQFEGSQFSVLSSDFYSMPYVGYIEAPYAE